MVPLALQGPGAGAGAGVHAIGAVAARFAPAPAAPDRPRLRLNRQDPLGAGLDFAELDAMADLLWAGTAGVSARP